VSWRLVYTTQAQKDAEKTPPPFEKLVGDLSGAYSRRINIQHRLVYQVLDDAAMVSGIPRSKKSMHARLEPGSSGGHRCDSEGAGYAKPHSRAVLPGVAGNCRGQGLTLLRDPARGRLALSA
jgi:Txe/YoeB family toxin of toxin-antitoxin system